jgi:hypothetical protein
MILKMKRIWKFVSPFVLYRIDWKRVFWFCLGTFLFVLIIKKIDFRSEIFLRVLERFGNSISDAMFWVLIIVCTGVVGVWMFKNIFLSEIPLKKKEDEE